MKVCPLLAQHSDCARANTSAHPDANTRMVSVYALTHRGVVSSESGPASTQRNLTKRKLPLVTSARLHPLAGHSKPSTEV